MDDRRFDSIVKALAQGRSRRAVLKGMLGFGGAAVVGSALEGDAAEAARRPAPTPTPRTCPGKQTWNGSACACQAPPAAGTQTCGPDCCNPTGAGVTHSECCDNACCFGTCVGEEICCPTNPLAGGGAATHKVCDGVCVALGVEGACCDDSDCPDLDACTVGSCQNRVCVQVPNTCDDGNICTYNSCDPEVGCVSTAVDCSDGDACTIDTCDPVLGCVHTAVVCNDGNACTIDSCDSERGCIYTRITCDDGNPCTVNACDPQLGCIFTPVDCSGLTNPATCVVGVCAGGTCTTQSTCSAGTGCCGDGTCSAACACLADGSACSVSAECCEGCCIANLPNLSDWEQVCQNAGLQGTAVELCAQMILELNLPSTCLTPNQIVVGSFPNNPITLPCA